MGIFRRTGSAKTSAARRAGKAAVATSAAVLPELPVVPVLVESLRPEAPEAPAAAERQLDGGFIDESDVFVCRRSSPEETPLPLPPDATVEEVAPAVTLFVFGWHHVEPGPLSWAFPSLRAALDAVRTMRNAAQWCIVSGNAWESLEIARAEGAVLIEQLG